MSKIGQIFFLLITAVLSGCSSVSYVEPKTGPTAKVRFATNSSDLTTVYEYSSTHCEGEKEMMRLRHGYLVNNDPRRLGIPLWTYHKNAAKELLVSADVPHVYMFKHAQTKHYGNRMVNTFCAVFISHEFEKNKDYEISYKWDGSTCHATLSEIATNETGLPVKILLQKRDNKMRPEFSEGCTKSFKKVRFW